MRLLVYDLGGSHVSVGLVGHPVSHLEAKYSTPLNANASAEEIFRTLQDCAAHFHPLLTGNGDCGQITGISVAIPNPFDYETGISYIQHKYGALYRCDVRGELSRRLGVREDRIHFLNDAAAFLLGELQEPAVKAYQRVMALTLGTGAGSAFAIDGQVMTTGKGIPPKGEIWCLPWGQGNVEDLISARRIRCSYEALTGTRMEVREIAGRATSDIAAGRVFEEFGRDLGQILTVVCGEFEAELIVLGGSISRSASLFLRFARAAMETDAPKFAVSTMFDAAALVGAGVYWQMMTVGPAKGPREIP